MEQFTAPLTACLPACLAWLLVAALHTPPETELPCVAYPALLLPFSSSLLFFAPQKKSPKVNAQLDIFNTRQQKANCTPYAGVPEGCRGQQGRGGAGGKGRSVKVSVDKSFLFSFVFGIAFFESQSARQPGRLLPWHLSSTRRGRTPLPSPPFLHLPLAQCRNQRQWLS